MKQPASKCVLSLETDIIRNCEMAIGYYYMVVLNGLSLFGLAVLLGEREGP